jgi:hypothetical protein
LGTFPTNSTFKLKLLDRESLAVAVTAEAFSPGLRSTLMPKSAILVLVSALHEVIKGHHRDRVADACHRIQGDGPSRVFLCEQRRSGGLSLGQNALNSSEYKNNVER